MDWQAFFKGLEDHSVSAIYYDNNTGLTVERLYQAFKARLMSEVATPFQNGQLMDMTDHAYLGKKGRVKKKDND